MRALGRVGKQYRVPMFVASSTNMAKAQEFSAMAEAWGLPPVRFTIRLHAVDKCVHVAYIEGAVADEAEFLFVPYSAFTVLSVKWKANPTPANPHEVELLAAADNRKESELLPLAPWH